MPKTLAPHQLAAALSSFDYFAAKRGTCPLIVAPVRAGKSLIMAEIMRRILDQAPRAWILSLAHVRTLLTQNAAELREHCPEVDYGFFCAGLGQKRLHNSVTFASIQSIHTQVGKFRRAPSVIIIDEAHLLSHNEATTYRRFINSCRTLNPNLVVIGLTGSPWRSDSGRLDEGETRLFDGTCYSISMRWMIEQGYWCRPVSPKLATKMDVTGVGVAKGDYIPSQLEKAVNIDSVTRACVEETLIHAAGRRKWLCFTAGIEHAENVRNAFRSYGISCEMLTGKMSVKQQDEIMAQYRRGDFRCLVVVAMCTTGVNIPDIDCIIYMRPMRSPVLYVQTLGRGVTVIADIYSLNTAEERLAAIAASQKPDCLLLDFGGVVAELGPVDAIEVRKRPSGPATQQEGVEVEASPFKRCPSCGNICMVQARYCLTCGYGFATQDLDRKASDKAVISTDSEPEEFDVFSVKLARHIKKEDIENDMDGLPLKYPPSLKVTYSTIGGSFSEWVCFEHHRYDVGDPKRFAWDKAVAWHKQRVPDLKPPVSIKEALYMGYDKVVPKAVIIRKEGKYSRIIGFNWNKNDTPLPPSSKYGDEIPF